MCTRAFPHGGFEKKFQLNEYVTVKGANLKDGLLTIALEREVPEEKRPQKISISNEELTNDKQLLGGNRFVSTA